MATSCTVVPASMPRADAQQLNAPSPDVQDLFMQFHTATQHLPSLNPVPTHLSAAAGRDTRHAGEALCSSRQPRQRVSLAKHKTARPFEFVYVDNKAYPTTVVGGNIVALVAVDVASWAVAKEDVQAKSANGKAFKRVAAAWQLDKVPWPVTVFSDGCGSMRHVREACTDLGLNYQELPPYDPALNPAELAIQILWSAARASLLHGRVDPHYYPHAVQACINSWWILPTTRGRHYISPHMAVYGKPGSYLGKLAVGTHAHLRKSIKNSANDAFHDPSLRAEPCVVLTQRSPVDPTYVVLVKRKDRYYTVASRHITPSAANRLGGSRSAVDLPIYTRNVGDYSFPDQVLPAQAVPPAHPLPTLDLLADQSWRQDTTTADPCDLSTDAGDGDVSFETASAAGPTCSTPNAADITARVHPSQPDTLVISQRSTDAPAPCFPDTPIDAGPPSYQRLSAVCSAHVHKVIHKARRSRAVPRDARQWVGPIKDIPWRLALESARRAEVVAALQKELDHLVAKILVPITGQDTRRPEAELSAQPGRFLLDLKRSGKLKARGVQQGHLEDRSIDGDFNYFSRVADLLSVRMLFFSPERQHRAIVTIDVAAAFLQSVKFDPAEKPRYLRFVHPVTKEKLFFMQTGPIYGSASSPSRWFNLTLVPWLTSVGFYQNPNEPCVFSHNTKDIVICTFVDDVLMDCPAAMAGQPHPDTAWFLRAISQRFECNDPEFLSHKEPIDFIGIDLCVDQHSNHYMSMANYIHKLLDATSLQDCKMHDVPVSRPVTDFTPLDKTETQLFMMLVGSIGWLAVTMRIDIKYAHSRVSQHLASPNRGALDMALQIIGYLRKHPNLCLAQLCRDAASVDTHSPWDFYTDSDHAGNSEPQNKRRSQYGAVALLAKTPVYYASKVWSTATAHPSLTSAHVSTSSAESEIYGMANATKDFLTVSYRSAALRIQCPLPMVVKCDNMAAKTFMDNTACKSTLKHIDCRAEWVQLMRDQRLFRAVHCPSDLNLADFLTKIQRSNTTFIALRDQLMVDWVCPF